MGNCFSTISDLFLTRVFQWLEEKGSYIHNLEKNLEDLESAMAELKDKRVDFLGRDTREGKRGLTRLAESWLDRVENIESRVNDIVSAKDVELQRLYLCGFCSKSLLSSYRYGKSVFLTLSKVTKLTSDVSEVLAEKAQTPAVKKRPLDQPTIVGQGSMLDKAWNHLMEDTVDIMGMYGMGGVGKTTLLTQLNNKFSNDKCGFDYVIWVTVSKELHIEKILDEIAHNVGLDEGEWKEKEKHHKRDDIYNFLTEKKFVLFLDDIWEKVKLADIGVPPPTTQNQCKVAFTTRSEDVCARMEVKHPMEVQCLADHEAFDLFQKKVRQITLESDPEIPILAKKVAKKCCGLPLALNVIGEAMSGKGTVQEWHDALNDLNSNADMDDKILLLLKYSYDNLKGEQDKQCLLYCALFPEDYEIPKEELIEYWICEGIIDGSEGIEIGENRGYAIIGSLVRASLLMDSGYVEGKSVVVCMHDVVREMALWIASDLGIQKEAFIVRAGVGLDEMPKVKNWSVVRRMSLMHNNIEHLAGTPECLELTTLLLQGAWLQNISSEFFKSMPKLTVLDLSGNYWLHELPKGISESLQFLNLSRTRIRHLALQGLGKLIHLDLENTRWLESIDGISSLHYLKVLKLFGSAWDFSDRVTELEALKHLEILTVDKVNEQFLRSHRLMSCTRSLRIWDFYMESSGISLPEPMGRNCSFFNLVNLVVFRCEGLRELTFLMFAPNLRELDVSFTNQLEDIINEEKACEVEESGIVPFQKLNNLRLVLLPELKNIYWSPLPFPCLKEIDVMYCPNLKKLPFDSQSGRQGEYGLIIRYHPEKWIEGVEWEDQDTKTRFLASCKLDFDSHSE